MKRTRRADIQRYLDKTKKIVYEQIKNSITKEDILDVDPDKKVKIKIPYIEEPYFKFAKEGKGGGSGGNGPGGGDNGNGSEHNLEIELTLEELADILFEYLGLPNLKNKGEDEVKEKIKVMGISKTGPRSRIHRKRTFKEIIKQHRVDKDVFRYRDIRIEEEPIFSAVVYLARDYSASMTEEKKFRVRSASFWILALLRRLYPRVQVKFIVHDTEAKFCDENYFFRSSEGGGTICSSAFELIKRDLKNYDLENNNFYIFYFSDGENLESDNPVLVSKVVDLAEKVNMIVYGEVYDKQNNWGFYLNGTLLNVLKPIASKFDNIFAEKLINVKTFIMKVFYNEQ